MQGFTAPTATTLNQAEVQINDTPGRASRNQRRLARLVRQKTSDCYSSATLTLTPFLGLGLWDFAIPVALGYYSPQYRGVVGPYTALQLLPWNPRMIRSVVRLRFGIVAGPETKANPAVCFANQASLCDILSTSSVRQSCPSGWESESDGYRAAQAKPPANVLPNIFFFLWEGALRVSVSCSAVVHQCRSRLVGWSFALCCASGLIRWRIKTSGALPANLACHGETSRPSHNLISLQGQTQSLGDACGDVFMGQAPKTTPAKTAECF